MHLSADADLSDLWKLKVFLLKGPSVSSATFESVAQFFIRQYSLIPIASLEAWTAESKFIKDGSINGLSKTIVESLFKEYSDCDSASIEISFIYGQDILASPDEANHLFTSRNVVTAICIDDLDDLSQHHPDDTAVVESSDVSNTKLYSNGNDIPTSHEVKNTHSIDISISHPNIKSYEYFSQLNDQFSTMNLLFSDANAILLTRDEVQWFKANTFKQQGSPCSTKPPLPDVWVVDNSVGNKKWSAISLSHFICRLLCKLLDAAKSMVNLSLEVDIPGILERGPRSLLGIQKKKWGDAYLLLGLPLPALGYYHEASQFFKASNDLLWQAASIESEAAALRLYELAYLEIDVAKVLAKRVSMQATSVMTSFPKSSSPYQHASSDVPLPLEIEQLSGEAPKRWPLAFGMGLLGSGAASSESSQFSSEISPNRIVATSMMSVAHGTDTCSSITSSHMANRSTILDLSTTKCGEAIQLYQRALDVSESSTACILYAECFLRKARLLASLGAKLSCMETLSRGSEHSKLLQTSEFGKMLLGCASIYKVIGAVRQFSFCLFRIALSQIDSNCAKQAENLLILTSSWYATAYLRLAEWKSAKTCSNLGVADDEVERLPCSLRSIMNILRNTAAESQGQAHTWESVFHHGSCATDFPPKHLRAVYSAESFTYLQKISEKLALSSHSFRRQRTTACRWGYLQVLLLESLQKAADKSYNSELSVWLSLAILNVAHSIFDAKAQKVALRRIATGAGRLTAKFESPPSLTIVAASETLKVQPLSPNTRASKPRRYSAHSDQEKRFFSTFPVFLGGITHGSFPPCPIFLDLTIKRPILIKTWSSSGATSSQLNGLNSPPFQATQRSSQQPNFVDFVRPISSLKEGSDLTSNSPQIISEVLSDVPASPLFLFTPWKNDSIASSFETIQANYWVAGELQVVQIKLRNPLMVEVILEKLSVITDGGSVVECQPINIALPRDHISTVDLHLVPKQSCSTLCLIGIQYTLSNVFFKQFILRNSNKLSKFVSCLSSSSSSSSSNSTSQFVSLNTDAISKVIRNSAMVQVDVVENIPHLSGSLKALTSIDLRSLSISDTEHFIDWESAGDPMIEGDIKELFLSLNSLSDINANIIQVYIIQEKSVTFEEWVHRLPTMRVSDENVSLGNPDNTDVVLPFVTDNGSTPPPPPFSFDLSIAVRVFSSFMSSNSKSTFTPTTSTPTCLTIYNKAPLKGETLLIPIQCKAIQNNTEGCIVVRYASSSTSKYVRHLLVPIRLTLWDTPLIYLNPEAFDIIPFLPFNERDVLCGALQLAAFSQLLTEAFRCLLGQLVTLNSINKPPLNVVVMKDNIIAAAESPSLIKPKNSSFAHTKALLNLEVINNSQSSTKCFAEDKECQIPSITCLPGTKARWLIPIPRTLSNHHKKCQHHNIMKTTENNPRHPFLEVAGQFHLSPVKKCLSYLRWTCGERARPLLLGNNQLGQQRTDGQQQPSEQRSKTHLKEMKNLFGIKLTDELPALMLSPMAFKSLEPPLLTFSIDISTQASQEDLQCNQYEIPCGVPMIVKIKCYFSNVMSSLKSEMWSAFLIPLESMSCPLRDTNENFFADESFQESDRLLWTPTLESHRMLPFSNQSKKEIVLHEVTLIAVAPTLCRIFIGAMRHSTQEILWHPTPIHLIAA